jgi:hypothetical protein
VIEVKTSQEILVRFTSSGMLSERGSTAPGQCSEGKLPKALR